MEKRKGRGASSSITQPKNSKHYAEIKGEKAICPIAAQADKKKGRVFEDKKKYIFTSTKE